MDLTGESSEYIVIEQHQQFWEMILGNVQEGFLMGCSINNKDDAHEKESPLGILYKHAYGATLTRTLEHFYPRSHSTSQPLIFR